MYIIKRTQEQKLKKDEKEDEIDTIFKVFSILLD